MFAPVSASVAVGSTFAGTTIASCGITIVYSCVSAPTVFDAVIVNEYRPGVVGVPEMIPVEGSRVSPGGRVPPVTANVIGPVPVAVTVEL